MSAGGIVMSTEEFCMSLIALIGGLTVVELAYVAGIPECEAVTIMRHLEDSGRVKSDEQRGGWRIWRPK